MSARDIIRVEQDDDVTACNGGGGALGHPLVYLRFEGDEFVDCYYCSRRFAKPGYREESTALA